VSSLFLPARVSERLMELGADLMVDGIFAIILMMRKDKAPDLSYSNDEEILSTKLGPLLQQVFVWDSTPGYVNLKNPGFGFRTDKKKTEKQEELQRSLSSKRATPNPETAIAISLSQKATRTEQHLMVTPPTKSNTTNKKTSFDDSPSP